MTSTTQQTTSLEKDSQYIRFVEVKKPREPLSPDQIDELTYLNFELNLKDRNLSNFEL
jgi:hypothetical protein